VPISDHGRHSLGAFVTNKLPLSDIDAQCGPMHRVFVSKPKKAKQREGTATPGTVIAAKIRTRANGLTDREREALMADAMRVIYGAEGDAVGAHRR
jgi:hypothetical protein